VSSEYHTEFNNIKHDYCAMPLWVFHNGKPVNIWDIEKVISGTLVEIQFKLCHFTICNKDFDSFNATVQQLQVLQPGWERPATIFKCKDFSNGPIEVSVRTCQPMFSHGLCNWYSQPTVRFLHNSYSSQCQPMLRFSLISYISRHAQGHKCMCILKSFGWVD